MEDKNYIENRAWLEEQRCPKCGAPMERGYVFGHWFNLRWSNKPKILLYLLVHLSGKR